MALGKLIFSPNQVHLIDEEYLYSYDKDLLEKGKEEVIKDHDHCMDAKRYAVMGLWKYIKQLLPLLEKED